jgi:hypothetical protein
MATNAEIARADRHRAAQVMQEIALQVATLVGRGEAQDERRSKL